MVEGLTSYQHLTRGQRAGVRVLMIREDPFHRSAPSSHGEDLVAAVIIQTHTIPVTPAERPHPFPSRTRKLSSPAPKILRGQPFGKIGRRRDCCVNAGFSGSCHARVCSLCDCQCTGTCARAVVACCRCFRTPSPRSRVGRGDVSVSRHRR
jgi:hypothetical protein